MGSVTPRFGIRYPDNNTKAINLGGELGDMGRDIEKALLAAGGAAPVDTGWLNVTMDPALKGAPAVRRIGVQCYARGAFSFQNGGTITSSFTTLATLPNGFVPAVQWLIGIGSSLPVVLQGIILPTGAIQVRTFESGGVAYTSSSTFSLIGAWLAG